MDNITMLTNKFENNYFPIMNADENVFCVK